MRRVVASIAVGSVLLGLAVAVAPAAQAATAGTAYTPLATPARVANAVSVPARKTVTRTLSGVPSGATAVALNVTATGGSAQGYLTVFKAGTTRPSTSSINFAARQTVANEAVVQTNGGGSVTIFNGSTQAARVYLDVTGYWSAGTSAQGSFGAIAPSRRLNTSAGVGAEGPLGSHRTLSFTATGGPTGIPSTASAVLVNLTAAVPTKAGYLTAFAASGSRPSASTMNFAAHSTLAHLAVVPVGTGGRVSVYNGSSGTVQVFGDVLGWFAAGDPNAAGGLGVLSPYRVLSSRTIGSHRTVSFSSAGRGGVPRSDVRALALNVRVASAANRGYLAVDPGSPVSTSNLNFAKGQSVANLVLAADSPSGYVKIYNGSSSAITVSADVTGFVLNTAITTPAISSSHYVRTTDSNVLQEAGANDATNGSTFVVLDLGAQLNDKTGVQLTATNTNISYATARSLVRAYVTGYSDTTDRPVTVALATNNEGSFSQYYATARGEDWATEMVEALRSSPDTPSSVTVVGADDIEPGFASTEAQAENWETYYLQAASSQGDSSSLLYFIGSADGCPTSYGQLNVTCGYGWTERQLFTLAGGSGSGRVRGLPQIYDTVGQTRWANIVATGGSTAGFVGALTEHGACPSATPACNDTASFTAPQGFAAMYHAMSTVAATPPVQVVTDLDILN